MHPETSFIVHVLKIRKKTKGGGGAERKRVTALLEDISHMPREKSSRTLMRRGPAETKNFFTIYVKLI